MKIAPTVVLSALILAMAWPSSAEEKKANEYLDAGVIIARDTISSISFVLPAYNQVRIADWLEISGKEAKNGQTVFISEQACFGAEQTVIVSKREPVVTKRDDGKWAISFR